ncbi:MAG TPA: hypothetical protein VF902_03595, partial [Coriobacteriia bacterium]
MRGRLGIVGTFALWSGIVLASTTVVVTVLATQQVSGLAVEASARSLSGAVNAQLVRALTAEQLTRLDPEDLASFDAMVQESIRSGDIRAVKVWDRNRRVVYSSFDKREVGKTFQGYENVDIALGGGIAFEVDTGSKAESAEESEQFGEVVEVYAPIVARPGGPTIGVFE